MQALESIIVNDFYCKCMHPGCVYKSRKSLDRRRVEQLGTKHAVKMAHQVVLLNHQIGVDLIGKRQPSLLDDPPPF